MCQIQSARAFESSRLCVGRFECLVRLFLPHYLLWLAGRERPEFAEDGEAREGRKKWRT